MGTSIRKYKCAGRPVYILWRGAPAPHDVCSLHGCKDTAVSVAAIAMGGLAILYTCGRHEYGLDKIDKRQAKPPSRNEDHVGFQILPKVVMKYDQ